MTKASLNKLERGLAKNAPAAADPQAAAAVLQWFAAAEADMGEGEATAAQRALDDRYHGQLSVPADRAALVAWERRMGELAPAIMGQFDVTAGEMIAELDRLEVVLK